MAMIQSRDDKFRTWCVITDIALLGCSTAAELFDGSSFYRCSLAPDEPCPITQRTVARAKRIQHTNGTIVETDLALCLTDRGYRHHRQVYAHSKYTHETELFFTYKTASCWLNLTADVHESKSKRSGERWVEPIAIPQTGLSQLQQLIQSVVRPQPPVAGV